MAYEGTYNKTVSFTERNHCNAAMRQPAGRRTCEFGRQPGGPGAQYLSGKAWIPVHLASFRN